MEYVLKTSGLTKKFANHLAVDSVSLHIKRGEIYGFIGKNGAGKTTFMKMISGLSSPSAGGIELFGVSGSETAKYHSRIGNLIEAPGLYPGMTGAENLKCKMLALGIHKTGYEKELLELVGLSQTQKKKVKNYSLGMRQRLGIAMALVGGPDFLVLDEPINGLDPQGMAEVRDMLLRLKEEKNMTIMVSSHILEELYKIADTFGIIHEGRLLQEVSREELSARCSDYTELVVADAACACPVLEAADIRQFKVVDSQTIHIYDKMEQLGRLNMALAEAGCMVESLRVVQETLENYFLKLTGNAGREESKHD